MYQAQCHHSFDATMRGAIFGIMLLLALSGCAEPASTVEAVSAERHALAYERSKMMRQHGLIEEAKGELIELVFSEAGDDLKAEVLYSLGEIEFTRGDYAGAQSAWSMLTERFPESPEALKVADELGSLSAVVQELTDTSFNNVVAAGYLKAGNFWSQDRSRSFTIDTSWLTNLPAAGKWYGKVTTEFPGTEASRTAYRQQLFTLLGWKGTSRFDDGEGVAVQPKVWLPTMIRVLGEFEQAFPEDASLPAFRFQIAQAYWKMKNWKETEKWLQEIIDQEGEEDSFYRDLAERRLAKLKY